MDAFVSLPTTTRRFVRAEVGTTGKPDGIVYCDACNDLRNFFQSGRGCTIRDGNVRDWALGGRRGLVRGWALDALE